MSRHADTGTSRIARVSSPQNRGLPEAGDSDFFSGNDAPSPTMGSDTTQLLPAASMSAGPETEVIPSVYQPPAPAHVSAQDETTLLQAVPDVPPPPPSAAPIPGALPGAAASDPGTATATAIAPPTPAPAQHRSSTLGMWAGVVVFWLLAMPIGVMSAVIVAGRRATLCSKSSTGFGCTSTGSSVGVVLLVIVVALVGTVSVYAYDVRHSARRWLAGLGIGVAMLAVLGLVAWLLVRTIQ